MVRRRARAAASSDEQVAAAAQKTIKESEERDGAPPTFNVAADVEGGLHLLSREVEVVQEEVCERGHGRVHGDLKLLL